MWKWSLSLKLRDAEQTQTVSVLLPTYNRSELIAESIDSLLAQTRPVDELIVIVDGSCDDTIEVLQSYGDKISFVRKPNGGKSSALNLGLQVSSGDLIWIFDDDDIALPNALETLTGLLAASPDADFAYGRHDRFFVGENGKANFFGTGYWKECGSEEFLWETLLDLFAHQGGMLVKKSLYDETGLFDETLPRSQDYEMLLRLALAGTPASTQDVIFHQRQHSGLRGTETLNFTSNSTRQMWCKFDQQIFRRLHGRLPLSAFSHQLKNDDDPVRIRRAFIRRGVAMARKQLWSLAHNDFCAAALISDLPLSPSEVMDLRETFGSKFQTDSILDETVFKNKLMSLSRLSPTGAAICGALGRGLLWRIRDRIAQGDFKNGLRYVQLVSEFAICSKLAMFQLGESWQETTG